MSTLSTAKIQEMVKKQQEQLKEAAIVHWMEILEAAKITVNIADAISIQAFLDELQNLYGELKELKEDILQCEDCMFGRIIDSINIKPNNKQFTLAQNCVANLYKEQRQLWVVPSGQNKARIAEAIDMISLLSGQSEIINMLFPNQYLMNRDTTEFELTLSSMAEDKARYHALIDDFIPGKNALIIVYEVEIFLLDDLCKFKAVIVANAFIGLAATTANTRKSLINYRSNSTLTHSVILQQSLLTDENIQARLIDEKAAYIQEIGKLNLVIIYCNQHLQCMIAANIQPVLITMDIDNERLRSLDQLAKKAGLQTAIDSPQLWG